MKVGFVTDSTCDLPLTLLQQNNISILPSKILVDGKYCYDYRDEKIIQEIYTQINLNKKLETDALSVDEITNIFCDILSKNDYDYLIVLTTMANKSKFFLNCTEAAIKVKKQCQDARKEKGFSLNPIIHVIDSDQSSVGLGIILSTIVKNSSEFLNFDDFLENIYEIKKKTNMLFIPNDIQRLFFNERQAISDVLKLKSYLASKLNTKPVLLFKDGKPNILSTQIGMKRAINKAISHLASVIYENQLAEPTIHLAYSGPLEELKNNKNYLRLLEMIQEKNIKIYKSNIGGALASHIGIRSLSISYITK
jgi:DegV family protein with EDD domain